MSLSFRVAVPGDEATVVRYVRGIAEAEGLAHKHVANEADYARIMFGPSGVLRGMFACRDGLPVGGAFWHPTVGTYSGHLGIYIEDVFVDEAVRGQGVGRAIFAEMARYALAEGYDRLTWSCKNDNHGAVGFYERLGSERLHDFTSHRLIGEALTVLAAS